jgi:hypothetical protein
MTTSTCNKCFVIILFILGCGLLLIPYPAIHELIVNRDLDTYNCTDARNFTYSGKSRGAYRATALANMTVPVSPANNNTDIQSNVVVVKLRYPGITTWLPYAFNTHDDTTMWFSGISKSVSRRDVKVTTNDTDWFQCVSDSDLAGGYTQPALPNLPLYYASCAGGVTFLFLGVFICCINSRREQRSRYDYIYLN